MKLEQLDHIAITVKDVNKAVEWYINVLGLERKFKEAWGDEPAMVCAGDTCLALFLDKGKAAAKYMSGSHNHIAFRTDKAGFEQAQAELKHRGIEFHFEDHDVTHSIYFRDPDGHELEITTHEVR